MTWGTSTESVPPPTIRRAAASKHCLMGDHSDPTPRLDGLSSAYPTSEADMNLEPPPPQAIVIFGASGDLTRRKVLPALYNLARECLLSEPYAVVGYARTDWTEDQFRAHARRAIEEFSRSPIDEEVWKPFSDSLHYMAGPFDDEDCFAPLHDRLVQLDHVLGTEGRRLYYCATPPSAFPLIVARLGECGPQEGARIVFEKPSITCRSPSRNRSASKDEGRSMRKPARSETSSRTTCCRSSPSWRWSRRALSRRRLSGTRR